MTGRRFAARNGMTLLEVVVALTVAGAALATGATVLGFLSDQRTSVGISELAATSTAREEIRYWLSHARVTTEGDAEFRGTNAGSRIHSSLQLAGDSTDNELTFVTNAETVVSTSGTQVRMYVRHDTSAAHGLVAELTPFRSRGVPVTIQLSPDATGFTAHYLGDVTGQQLWQRSWVSTSVLPAAVELRIRFANPGEGTTSNASRNLISMPMCVVIAGRQ